MEHVNFRDKQKNQIINTLLELVSEYKKYVWVSNASYDLAPMDAECSMKRIEMLNKQLEQLELLEDSLVIYNAGGRKIVREK